MIWFITSAVNSGQLWAGPSTGWWSHTFVQLYVGIQTVFQLMIKIVSCEWTETGRGVSYPPRRQRVTGSMLFYTAEQRGKPGSETCHMTAER